MATAKAAAKSAKKKSNVDQAMEIIEGLTLLEMSELVKNLEDKFGVTAAAPMAAMPVAGAAAAGAEAAEEKTELTWFSPRLGQRRSK
jgi:ribosomal protein L7/L12